MVEEGVHHLGEDGGGDGTVLHGCSRRFHQEGRGVAVGGWLARLVGVGGFSALCGFPTEPALGIGVVTAGVNVVG